MWKGLIASLDRCCPFSCNHITRLQREGLWVRVPPVTSQEGFSPESLVTRNPANRPLPPPKKTTTKNNKQQLGLSLLGLTIGCVRVVDTTDQPWAVYVWSTQRTNHGLCTCGRHNGPTTGCVRVVDTTDQPQAVYVWSTQRTNHRLCTCGRHTGQTS